MWANRSLTFAGKMTKKLTTSILLKWAEKFHAKLRFAQQFLAKCKWTTYWPARVIDTFWNLFSELQKTRSGNARNDADFKEKSAKWSRGIVAGWQQEWIPPKWRTWRKWGKRMSLLWNFKCVYNLSKIFKSILQKLQLLMATRSVGILSTTIDFLTWTRAQSSRKKLL